MSGKTDSMFFFFFIGILWTECGILTHARITPPLIRCPEAMYLCPNGECENDAFSCTTETTLGTTDGTSPTTDTIMNPSSNAVPDQTEADGTTESKPDSNMDTTDGITSTPSVLEVKDDTTENVDKTDLTADSSTIDTADVTTQGTTVDTSDTVVDKADSNSQTTSGSIFQSDSTASQVTTNVPVSTTDTGIGKDIITTKGLPITSTVIKSSVSASSPGIPLSSNPTTSQGPTFPRTTESTWTSTHTSQITASSTNTITTSTQTASLVTSLSIVSSTNVPTSIPSISSTVQKSTPAKRGPGSRVPSIIILVFKGHLANRYHFKSYLTSELSTRLNQTIQPTQTSGTLANRTVFLLSTKEFGPGNRTITTELSVVEYYNTGNTDSPIDSVFVSPAAVLSVLKDNKTNEWTHFKIGEADIEFVCGYSSIDKPCAKLPFPDKSQEAVSKGLFHDNKNLFIAVFVLGTLCLLLIILGLIYVRCRQRRVTYYTNCTLEKAKLTYPTQTNPPEVNSPMSDKEILKTEIETSLNQNGAPPGDKEEGWIIPLDQAYEKRKNSETADTKL